MKQRVEGNVQNVTFCSLGTIRRYLMLLITTLEARCTKSVYEAQSSQPWLPRDPVTPPPVPHPLVGPKYCFHLVV